MKIGVSLTIVAACGWLVPFFLKGEHLSPKPQAAETQWFQRFGWIPGEGGPPPVGRVYWSSWCGSDANTGTLKLGPFTAPGALLLHVRGYPSKPGNQIFLESVATGKRLYFRTVDPGEDWGGRVWVLPGDWAGLEVRLICIDAAKDLEGWFAIGEPRRASPLLGLWLGYWEHLHGFLTVGFLVILLTGAVRQGLRKHLSLGPGTEAGVALAGVAMIGYLAAILAFVSPALGRLAVFAVLGWALVSAVKAGPRRSKAKGAIWMTQEPGSIFILTAAVGAIYFSLLLAYAPESTLSRLPGSRYFNEIPADNTIPEFYAQRLWSGLDVREKFGDWLSSDRPPLQVGWDCLFGGPISLLTGDFDTCAQYAGIWFQLIWIAAGWGWLRRVGLGFRGATAVMIAVSATGIFALNTVFVWPKMAAAGLLLIAYTLWFEHECSKRLYAVGGACAALAWLAHGGVAFACLGLIPLVWHRAGRRKAVSWCYAGAAFALTVLPWFCYQRFCDPPGNRLLKMHLAGVTPVDSRSFGKALGSAFEQVGWRQWLQNRTVNFETMTYGSFRGKIAFSGDAFQFRLDESRFFFLSLGWWGVLGVVLLVPLFSSKGRFWASARRALLWIGMSLVVWGLLMFNPGSTINHQGSYLFQLMVLLVLSSAFWRISKIGFVVVAIVQAADFIRVWVPPATASDSRTFHIGPLVGIVLSLGVLAFLLSGKGVNPSPSD